MQVVLQSKQQQADYRYDGWPLPTLSQPHNSTHNEREQRGNFSRDAHLTPGCGHRVGNQHQSADGRRKRGEHEPFRIQLALQQKPRRHPEAQ